MLALTNIVPSLQDFDLVDSYDINHRIRHHHHTIAEYEMRGGRKDESGVTDQPIPYHTMALWRD